MYRAPTSSGGATGFLMLLFILWGAFYVSGCAETPSDPGFDNLPPVGDVEIELATAMTSAGRPGDLDGRGAVPVRTRRMGLRRLRAGEGPG